MSLLKEGDGVNFQKASCTLDGCVKIYTSRVDSVATETGKLLSGLADSGNKKRKGEEEGDAQAEGEDEEEGEGEDGVKKKTKKKSQRSSENTLVSSFAQLQLKKMELEFSVDPLFKKASADFDEGGAKGLLLNHLTIDAQGRIAFDSSDDVREQEEQVEKDENEDNAESDVDIDVEALGLRFFPDLERIDEQDICPSLKTFELGGGDDTLDIPFLKAPEDWRKDEEAPKDENQDAADFGDEPLGGFDDDDDGVGGGFDVIDMGEVGFGEGGEAWAREAAMHTQPRVALAADGMVTNEGEQGLGDEVGGFEANSARYGIALVKDKDFSRNNILSYFDQALQKNWAGPEHWRIRKIKDSTKPTTTVKRKEKEPFEIDFMAPLTQAMADMIYTPATTNATISLPKSQWKSKTRNLLPDDKHFNSRQLLRLFLKPKARIGAKRQVAQTQSYQPGGDASGHAHSNDLPDAAEMDEAYWARQHAANTAAASTAALDDDPAQAANYDANFFQDDGLALPGMGDDDDNDHFADAAEHFPVDGDGGSQPLDSQSLLPSTQESGFGTQLVTQSRRLRPEYVQYARVATRVDVRRLKEEMWRDIGVHSSTADSTLTSPEPTSPTTPTESSSIGIDKALEEGELRFTDVINNLQSVYSAQTMADISTSYCFIALLHLANEKGLVLRHEEGFGDIRIARDSGAVVVDGEE